MRFSLGAVLATASLIHTTTAAIGATTEQYYAPKHTSCPEKNLLRKANNISDEEAAWVKSRHNITNEALIDFLNRANMTDFDAEEFITNKTAKDINIALAFSGGGFRAMLAGAGQLSALDDRVDGALEHGLGGILQASTYVAGLSGGSWLVGSLVFSNWSSMDDILDDGDIWDLSTSLLLPYGELSLLKDINFWLNAIGEVQDKEDAGFDTSITDYWGRIISPKFFVNSTGVKEAWSDIRDLKGFADHEFPFPIIVADGRAPGTTIFNTNSTVFEINPYEFGSWDPSLYSFTDIMYLGTNMTDGVPENNDSCVIGFDNAGFMIGTSSSIFTSASSLFTGVTGTIGLILTTLFTQMSAADFDIANYAPNPFKGSTFAGNRSIARADTLYLADGGFDGQTIPFDPFLIPEREVDVIFAFDNDAVDSGWPDGRDLISTYMRQFTPQGNKSSFPQVPTEETFVTDNFTAKPTFFGCNYDQLVLFHNMPPLIIYTANRPFTFNSNTSTDDLIYSEEDKRGMIQNGFETTSRFNLTLDSEYNACVGCAIISRQQHRQGIAQTDQCVKCFEKYCWHGEEAHYSIGANFTFTPDGATNGSTNMTFTNKGPGGLI